MSRTAIIDGKNLYWSSLIRVYDVIFKFVLDGNLSTRSQFLYKVAGRVRRVLPSCLRSQLRMNLRHVHWRESFVCQLSRKLNIRHLKIVQGLIDSLRIDGVGQAHEVQRLSINLVLRIECIVKFHNFKY